MERDLKIIKIKRLDSDLLTAEFLTIKDRLADFYEQIGCRCIDIVCRRFGGVVFDVICDDEALLKDDPGLPVSWWQKDDAKEGLFGTLLLCHHDSEGNLTDATEEELLAVQMATREIKTPNGTIMILFHEVG